MTSGPDLKLSTLYEDDYQLWLDKTVSHLKAHAFESLDLENLIEEIESLGKRDKRAISSYLRRLCEHLLKIRYWQSEREACYRGWDREVAHFRLQIQAILKDSPSLKNYLKEVFASEYENARKLFLKQSQLEAGSVPEVAEFSLEQALAEDWLPWQPT